MKTSNPVTTEWQMSVIANALNFTWVKPNHFDCKTLTRKRAPSKTSIVLVYPIIPRNIDRGSSSLFLFMVIYVLPDPHNCLFSSGSFCIFICRFLSVQLISDHVSIIELVMAIFHKSRLITVPYQCWFRYSHYSTTRNSHSCCNSTLSEFDIYFLRMWKRNNSQRSDFSNCQFHTQSLRVCVPMKWMIYGSIRLRVGWY